MVSEREQNTYETSFASLEVHSQVEIGIQGKPRNLRRKGFIDNSVNGKCLFRHRTQRTF